MSGDLFSPGEPVTPKPGPQPDLPVAHAVRLLTIERPDYSHAVIAQHEDGAISLLTMGRETYAALKAYQRGEADTCPLPPADLTFDADLVARLARGVLAGNREVMTGVNGAARMLAAMVILQMRGPENDAK